MYRIELSPGEETVFRTIEELAVAVRRGVVTPRARIYHNASSRWLPIQIHPHYKAAVSMPLTQAALVAGPTHKPLSSLTLEQSGEPLPPALSNAALESTAAAPVEKPKSKSKPSAEKPGPKRRRRTTPKPRRQLRIALVGALLVGGAQWVLSAPLFSRADAPVLIRAHRQLISMPTEAMNRVSSPNSAGMVPVIPHPPASNPSAPLDELAAGRGSSVPSFGGTSAALPKPADLEPAPSVKLAASSVPSVDSLRSQPAESTAKAVKNILPTVSGASVQEPQTPRR
jgi:hypothetical protein